MKPRAALPSLRTALSDTPVVLVHGARQVGKTTLVRSVLDTGHDAEYFTLDDVPTRAAATDDPVGFIARFRGAVAIDEVQRAEELLLAIKASVDRDRRPGRFLLTGSANILMLPKLADSLAGRMEIITLWPFAQAEIEAARSNFVDLVFSGDRPPPPPRVAQLRQDVIARIFAGGYPEAIARDQPGRRGAWFDGYISNILQRDIRDLANIERHEDLLKLLGIIVARTGSLLSYASLAVDTGLPQTTLKRYFALLEQVFLIRRLPAWSSNRANRLVKSPKVHVCDSGLAAHLMGVDAEFVDRRPDALGALLESFVFMEIIKQAAWSKVQPRPYHFRTVSGREIDLVLERRSGELVGVEVKAGATVRTDDFKGLRQLQEIAGKRMVAGIVLHLGEQSISFGQNLHAVPIHRLWSGS